MADSRAQVVIDGEVGPLRQKLREASQHMQGFGNQAGASMGGAGGALDALRGKFIAITALLAGGAIFGKAIQETAAYTEQSIQLGKALGQSAGDASVWINVLADAGVTFEEFGGAAKGLLKNLQADEKGLNAMGLATRDANGKLLDMNTLITKGIALVNEHKEGTDRNIAARQIFGKSVDASSNILKINSETITENKELMEKLGLVVGQSQVENYKAHDDAMDKAHLVMKAFSTTIGNALMPVLTKLGQWFVEIGPPAVVVIRGAIGGLVSVFWGLKNAVTIVWELLNGLIFTVAEPLRSLVSAMYKLLTGDLSGARDELMNWPSRIGDAWGLAWKNIVASSEEARDKIEKLFLDGPPAAAAPKGGRTATPGAPPTDKKEAVASLMQYYELALAEEKRLASEKDALHEYTKEQELAFWRTLLTYAQLSANDRVAIQRKAAQLEIEVRRKAAMDQKAVDEELTRRAGALALGEVEARRAAARVALDNGQIDKEQALRLEAEHERQRYEIQSQALQERIKLLAADPTTSPQMREQLNTQLLELEQQYQTKRTEILGQLAGEKSKGVNTLATGFGDIFGGELEKTLTQAQSWQQAMGSIFRETGLMFLREIVIKPMAAYVASLAKMLLVKLGFLGQETAAQTAGSAATVAVKSTEATVVTGANAIEAASGSAAAMAAIPVVGPGLALGAMAAMMAAVLALRSGLKSARGGYDIPSGVNPMTQLHEEEMVLPKQFANVIRGLAGGDAPAPARASAPIELRGVSAGEFFIAARRDLIKVLEGAHRDFAFAGVRR